MATPSSYKQAREASKQAGARDPIPDFARPLVDRISASGVHVRWGFRQHEWFLVDHLIKKCGIPAMAATAVRAARRTDVDSARYFLPGWRELPPQPAPGTQRPQLRAVGGTSTTDERVAQGQALAAMFREQEQQALNPGHPQETA
ncbi:hypothetical protein [Streptomyces albus]|uniref:hypothetical protein n=1 Tax=Streptomyces albus TaxID=1888 RepID=UPI0033DEC157